MMQIGLKKSEVASFRGVGLLGSVSSQLDFLGFDDFWLKTKKKTWLNDLTSTCQKTGQNVTILDKVISEVGILLRTQGRAPDNI